jgi:hypothetical protein
MGQVTGFPLIFRAVHNPRFVALQKSRSDPRGQYPDFFPEISRISTLITAVFRSVSSE